MNQLKQKIIETEKEFKKLSKSKDNSTGHLYSLAILNTTLSALKLAEEIQDENIKRLKMNLYNTSPAIIKDEPRCSKIIDEVFE